MSTRQNLLLRFCLSLTAFVYTACGGDDGIIFHCSYEESKTSCSSSTYSDWAEDCLTVDFELKEGLSKEQYCSDTFPPTDTECGGNCCISYKFRNVSVGSGPCD